jgi:hypothetical protein
MASYSKTSKLQPAKAMQEAVHYFGPGGVGLDVQECTDDCARFEGGGGHVLVQVCEANAGSEVELETREWDYDVQRFLERI